ncbi:MAG: RagB/SusD family nutrient uptake outer membrane protein, partial [Bacteroides intestinalis]|nr:RagB/SusD family nutrient uptake outer membrane protein [Bacteroides intestinalis]
MKINRYISVAFMVIILSMSSCDSFLDDQPRGNAIAETTDHYNGLFNTITFMNMTMADYTHWLIDQIQLTPECIANFPTTITNHDQYSAERAFRYQKDVYKVTENCTAWERCYKNIYTYNVIANEVMNSSDGTEMKKKAIQAEARVSRAWMHFILAQLFSKPYNANNADTELTIPIVKDANSNEKSFERATMKDLYHFIITEMEESCPELEDRKDHNMRIYKTTGYALLGKMYWMMGEYEKALGPLRMAYERLKNETDFYILDFNALQEKYGYRELTLEELSDEEQMMPNYLLPYTYANPEFLWVKQNTFLGVFYIAYFDITIYYLKKECYDLFDDNDLRRNLIPTKDKNGTPYPYP